ncbi:hypothetical protein PoB_001683500 [Plakobranchus ocellatus]|uniref:Uncharacterized protein n=1 Tax=Plakobranchus ocellatus TaxID=259542 RepID=A0AAV3Z5A0_9GAST|nr:hypothetical protein PoB_001683500 [Plakobranchus ocellatus]
MGSYSCRNSCDIIDNNGQIISSNHSGGSNGGSGTSRGDFRNTNSVETIGHVWVRDSARTPKIRPPGIHYYLRQEREIRGSDIMSAIDKRDSKER